MKQLYLLIFLCCMPNLVMANVMISSMVFIYPPIILLLPAVIFLEAYILKRYLRIEKKEARFWSLRANLMSTFIGIPLAYIFLEFLGYNPYRAVQHNQLFFETVLLIILFFVVTCLIEYLVIEKGVKVKNLIKAVFYANAASYLFLIGATFVLLNFLTYMMQLWIDQY